MQWLCPGGCLMVITLFLITELRKVGLKSSSIIGEIVESEEAGSIQIF